MSASIRAGSIAPFAGTARGLALNPAALQGRAGLDPADVENADGKLPAAAVAALLQSAAAEAGRADFGLMMAQSWSLADLGPASLAVVYQDTLREALIALARHRLHVSEAIALDLHEDSQGARSGYPWTCRPAPNAPSWSNSPRAWRSSCAASCSAPAGCPRASASATPVRWTWLRTGACSAASRLSSTPCRRGAAEARRTRRQAPRMLDPALRRHAEALLEHLPSSRSESMAERAARVIRSRLAGRLGRSGQCGRCLDLNGRTFQRRLQAEGLGFSDLLDQVRAEVAKACWRMATCPCTRSPNGSVTPTAAPSTRWFSCKFGLPPSRWREDARNGPCGAGERRSA